MEDGILHSISGDWTEIAPGIRVRLFGAPNEEDMHFYNPQGVVILEVDARRYHDRPLDLDLP